MRSVSLNLTISSVMALGLHVVVRTILSFSIQVEMEGDLPWRIGRPGQHQTDRSGSQGKELISISTGSPIAMAAAIAGPSSRGQAARSIDPGAGIQLGANSGPGKARFRCSTSSPWPHQPCR